MKKVNEQEQEQPKTDEPQEEEKQETEPKEPSSEEKSESITVKLDTSIVENLKKEITQLKEEVNTLQETTSKGQITEETTPGFEYFKTEALARNKPKAFVHETGKKANAFYPMNPDEFY